MPLTITIAKVTGQHSTPVDITGLKETVEECFSLIKETIIGELSFRPVHVSKRQRPLVVAVGYEEHAPNSVELLVFKTNEPTGRPATLFLHNEESLLLVLGHMSERLYQSRLYAGQRLGGTQPTFVNDNYEKHLRQARTHKNDRPKLIHGTVSAIRSRIKATKLTWAVRLAGLTAEELNAMLQPLYKFPELNTQSVSDNSTIDALIVYTLEQFGLVEIIGLTDWVLLPGASMTVTGYCLDLAEEWVKQENTKIRTGWEMKIESAKTEVARKERKIEELKNRLQSEQAALGGLVEKLNDAIDNPPPTCQMKQNVPDSWLSR